MKRLSLVLLILLALISSVAFADYTSFVRSSTSWSLVSSESKGTTTNGSNYVLFYNGAPATRSGEVDTASAIVSFGGSIGSNLQVGKKAVTFALGVDVESSFSFSIAKNSAPLEAGEYVDAYWRKNYQKYELVQDKYEKGIAVDFNEDGVPISGQYYHEVFLDRVITYAYKPILPQITFVYYSPANASAQIAPCSSEPLLYEISRIEVFEYINGEYVLVGHTF